MTPRTQSIVPALLVALAGLSAAPLFFGFLFPQTPARAAKPTFELVSSLAFWKSITELDLPVPRTAAGVLVAIIAAAVLAFAGYATALVASWKVRERAPHIGWALIPCMLLFCVAVSYLPNFDSDIYNYIMRGRVAAVHGQNPYLVIADTFPDDPIYPYAEKRYTSSLDAAKLPSWKILNVGLAWLAGDDPVRNVILYRSTFLLLNIGNVLLIWRILKRIQPDLAFFGVVAYGWNPIVVLFGQSKTDTLMVFYLLAGVYLLASGRKRGAAVLLALSAWIKLITLPLLGVQWLGDLKLRKWRAVAVSVAIFLAVTVLIYLPFWDGPQLIVRHLTQMDKAASSVPGFVKTMITAGFVLVTLGAGYVQDGSLSRLLRAWTVVMLYFALFLTKLNLCWYLMIPIAVAAVSTSWVLLTVTAACSFCCLVLTYRDVAFSREYFPAPELIQVPRIVVYLVIPALTIATIGAYSLWTKRRAPLQPGAAK